jgi:hypothetical protein
MDRIPEADVGAAPATRMRAALLALSGHPRVAQDVMSQARDAFAPLDTVLDALSGRLLADSPPAMWRVGWPLYLEPYNERQVVHRARVIVSGLFPMMASRFARLQELAPRGGIIRRGFPFRIERHDDQFVSYIDARTFETLLPSLGVEGQGAVPADLAIAGTAPSHAQGSVSGFVPSGYDAFRDLPHQAIRYVRDGKRFVDFYAKPPDAPGGDCHYQTGFFLLGGDLALQRRSVDSTPWSAGMPILHYSVPILPGTYVYSIEARDTTCRIAARARYLLKSDLPGRSLAMSDVLLVDGQPAFSPRRETAAGITVAGRPGLEVSMEEPVSFYWEVYGVHGGAGDVDSLRIEIEAVDLERGRVAVTMLGRLRERAESAKPVSQLTYVERVPSGDGPLGMALTVQIPRTPGAVMRVRVRVTDLAKGGTVDGERNFYVRREPG